MKQVVCDDCKIVIGLISEDALVLSTDPFMGIDKYCHLCKLKHTEYKNYIDTKNDNDLLRIHGEEPLS